MRSQKDQQTIHQLNNFPTQGERKANFFNQLIAQLICQLSGQEFNSHREELHCVLEPCSHGATAHKKCKGIHVIKVCLISTDAKTDPNDPLDYANPFEEETKNVETDEDDESHEITSTQDQIQFGQSSHDDNRFPLAPIQDQNEDYKDQTMIQEEINVNTAIPRLGMQLRKRCLKKSNSSDSNNQAEDERQILHSLVSQMMSKMTNHKGQLHCPFIGCNRQFTEAGNLKTHIRTHLPDRVFKCSHPGCTKTFKLKQHLKHHEGSHLNVDRYICAVIGCQKTFSRASRLDLHIKSVHSGHNLFECVVPGCGKIFAEKGNLLVHTRTHTGEKPYHCGFCPKRFTTIGNCRDHERRHTNDKPYPCRLCTVKYYRKYQLVKHVASKHPGQKIAIDDETVSEQSDDDVRGDLVLMSDQLSQEGDQYDQFKGAKTKTLIRKFTAKSTLIREPQHSHIKKEKTFTSMARRHLQALDCYDSEDSDNVKLPRIKVAQTQLTFKTPIKAYNEELEFQNRQTSATIFELSTGQKHERSHIFSIQERRKISFDIEASQSHLKECSIDLNFRNLPYPPRLQHKNSDAFSFGPGCKQHARRKLTEISDLDEVVHEDLQIEQENFQEDYDEVSIFQEPRPVDLICQPHTITQFSGSGWNFENQIQKDSEPFCLRQMKQRPEIANNENLWIIREEKQTEILDELRQLAETTHNKLNNNLEFNLLPSLKAYNELSLPFGSEKGHTPTYLPKKSKRSPISINGGNLQDFHDFVSEYSPLFSPNIKLSHSNGKHNDGLSQKSMFHPKKDFKSEGKQYGEPSTFQRLSQIMSRTHSQAGLI
ncbi:hypothetical protein FGO68_gene1965 [Halteria grandinella]|uniref:C2H2-type domain-containing protein n=1 Tax=Halteria grandinella TaxID=5974 RepID=A0A8J8P3B6_HALGN|nr:hypothetical protein FGO68_gene1965 [Halteria grandinella]